VRDTIACEEASDQCLRISGGRGDPFRRTLRRVARTCIVRRRTRREDVAGPRVGYLVRRGRALPDPETARSEADSGCRGHPVPPSDVEPGGGSCRMSSRSRGLWNRGAGVQGYEEGRAPGMHVRGRTGWIFSLIVGGARKERIYAVHSRLTVYKGPRISMYLMVG